jgi:hypothetical protein
MCSNIAAENADSDGDKRWGFGAGKLSSAGVEEAQKRLKFSDYTIFYNAGDFDGSLCAVTRCG